MLSVLKKIFLIVSVSLLLSACTIGSFYTNSGHRAGGDFSLFPENSLLALKESCCGRGERDPLQHRQDFVYLEFDVRETADHELVVFHDSSLRRMIDGGTKRHRVKRLGLDEIQRFRFKGWEQEGVPTLMEFIQTAMEMNLHKPMVIEIKNIYSVQGLERLLEVVDYYQKNYAPYVDIIYEKDFDFPKSPVILMCFKWNLPKPIKENSTYWKSRLQRLGLDGIFQPKKHHERLL